MTEQDVAIVDDENVTDASPPDDEASATMAAKVGQKLEAVDTGLPIGVRAGIGLGGTAVLVLVLELVDFPAVATIVQGVQLGGIFALVALGIALVYKSTRVLNFAQGAFGSFPTFIALYLMLLTVADSGLGDGVLGRTASGADISFMFWVLTAVLAMVIGGLLAVATNVLLIQKLASAGAATSLVATAAAALFIIGLEALVFDAQLRTFPRPIDDAPPGFSLFGACFAIGGPDPDVCSGKFALGGQAVPWHTFVVIFVLTAAAVALALFFQTPAGVALLGTAQEPFAAELHGVSVKAMATLAWGTAGVLGAISGMLAAGFFEQAFPGYMTRDWVIPAFTGAVLGGITSMPGAVAGALLLGLVASAANNINAQFDLGLPSPPQLATIIVLVGVLIVKPLGLFGKEA